jgi:RES domain-containing protein
MGGFPAGRVRLKAKCCISCFNHPFIRDLIQEQRVETGKCDYCGSNPRRLIPIDALADYFHNLADMYDAADDGYSLISLVQDGWYVFSDRLHESGNSKDLLEDILNSDWDDDSGEWPVDAWDTYRAREVLPEVESWEAFCDAVAEEPEAEPDFGDYFEEQLAMAELTLPAGKILYRARAGWTTDEQNRRLPFRGVEIGAPPADKTEIGRANRKGRAVLYCAESEQTAVAEVRPARGYWVSTCQLRSRRELRILDLIDGIPEVHPFTDETLAWSVQFSDLLHSFGEALSTPLARSDDTKDYLPSQKLCEYAERLGYDGVRYPSALEDGGVNLVFFDPAAAEILDSNLVEVTSVKVAYHPRWFPHEAPPQEQ